MKERIIYHELGKDALYKTWHASEEHLFMYVYSEGGSIVSGEKVFPLQKGTLVFIAAGTYHYTMPDNPENYERSKLTIAPQKFEEMITVLKGNTFSALTSKAIVYAVIPEKDREEIDLIYKESTRCSTEDENELLLLSCCMKLLLFLNKYSIESTLSTTGFMSKAMDYINKNISNAISVDDICFAVGISKYHFCREFKKHTGLTVMEYILQTRIVLAKNDLLKTKLSITEISERNGFSSVSFFCRVFKEEEKLSPLQYRKSACTYIK